MNLFFKHGCAPWLDWQAFFHEGLLGHSSIRLKQPSENYVWDPNVSCDVRKNRGVCDFPSNVSLVVCVPPKFIWLQHRKKKKTHGTVSSLRKSESGIEGLLTILSVPRPRQRSSASSSLSPPSIRKASEQLKGKQTNQLARCVCYWLTNNGKHCFAGQWASVYLKSVPPSSE